MLPVAENEIRSYIVQNFLFGVDDTAMTFEETQKLYKEESPVWLEAVTSLGLAPS